MPQLEGQPGSRGMNPPGGISTINLYNWSQPSQPSAPSRRNNQSNDENLSQGANESTPSRPSAGVSPWAESNRGISRMYQAPGGTSSITFGVSSSPAENDASLKRRPGYDEKRKELYGSGIFNETSGSCDGDAGYGRIADKGPAAGDSQGSYGANEEIEFRPTNHFEGSKQREVSAGLSGTSNEHLSDMVGRLSFSDAKAREMAGDNIFGSSPMDAPRVVAHNREPAGKRSQLMLNNQDPSENPDPYGQKKHEMKSAELSGNNIFHGGGHHSGDDMPQYQQQSSAKVREMSGSDIFSNDQPKARNTVGGIRKPPGGGSTIMLA